MTRVSKVKIVKIHHYLGISTTDQGVYHCVYDIYM